MDRKLFNNLDGFAVDEYAGTFTGSFDVGGADAKHLAYDDEVLLVVRARVKPPRLKEMKNGDIVRVNVLGVKEAAVVRSDELKKHLCDTLGLDVPSPQLTLHDALQGLTPPDQGEGNEVEVTPAAVDENAENNETDVEVFSPTSAPAAGPKVQKFRPDEALPELGNTLPEEADTLSIKTTKDKRLAAFLAES